MVYVDFWVWGFVVMLYSDVDFWVCGVHGGQKSGFEFYVFCVWFQSIKHKKILLNACVL